jgi:hypothetical protein
MNQTKLAAFATRYAAAWSSRNPIRHLSLDVDRHEHRPWVDVRALDKYRSANR